MRLATFDEPSDEVELGERDEAPVEPAHDQERSCERVERLHVFLLDERVPNMNRYCTDNV